MYIFACLFIYFTMLKRRAFNRIFVSTIVFFIILFLYSVHKNSNCTYGDNNIKSNSYLYSLNDDNYVSKASIYVSKNLTIEQKIKQKLEAIIKDNSKNILLPSYINPIIPENTKVEKVLLDDGIIKVFFSKELLNITEEQSEKLIEAIIYTITDDNVLGVEIYVDGNILKYVPKTDKKIKGVLTRDFGINKTYEIVSSKDIVKIVMNYYGKDGDTYYEIPVTKYVNSNKEKLEVIIDEYNKNNSFLIGFLNNLNIGNYIFDQKTLKLYFNDNISFEDGDIFFKTLFDNYNIDKIIIYIDNQKKVEKYRKDVEK